MFRYIDTNSLDVRAIETDSDLRDASTYTTKMYNSFQGVNARMFDLGTVENKVVILD